MQTRLSLSLVACATLGLSLSAQKPASAPSAMSVLAPSQAAVPTTFLSSPGWQHFLAEHRGEWTPQWCAATGTPRAIWGSGIPLADWRENSLDEARRHAQMLLQDQNELLGLGTSEFREVIGSRMGRTWTLVYDQFFRGLPVIGGRADVRVHMVGRVPMFGSQAWQIPADFDTGPRLTPEVATACAWQALGQQPTGVSQPGAQIAPRLVIWGDINATELATVYLAWEVSVSNVNRDGEGPIGRYYIDAQTGATLHYTSDKHECGFPGCTKDHTSKSGEDAALPLAPVNTTVTVMGWTRTGNDAFSALVNVPMPGLELNVPGIGTVTTDNNGQFTINIAAAVSISVSSLNGRHHATMAGSSAPSGSFNVSPGVPATIQLLTAGASTAQAAHTTTSWWTDRTNEFCRAILGNSAELNTADAVVPTVNIASTCNAYYTGNTINFYASGGGCANTAFSTVVSHEWGHGLDDRYGGISQIQGLSEGWGDTLALYIVDNPILGSGFQTAGVGIRDGNNTTMYPPPAQVHAAGEVWMGFAWQLRDHLAITLGNRSAAIALTNDIVLGTIVADATDQPSAVTEVFIADDNDGNLANGTPHSTELIWACNQKNLPYPGGGGPQPPANNECVAAISLVNGLNGPYTNTNATTSSPSWPCGLGQNDVWFQYVTNGSGTLTVDTCGQAGFDTQIQIFSGGCGALNSLGCNDDNCSLQSLVSTAVTPGAYLIRVGGYNGASGSFSLNVSGPGGGVLASSTPFGAGCYHTSKAFYELFGTAAANDLAGTNLRLVKSGDYYIAQTGGSFVAPHGSATALALTDDSEVTVNLAGSFPYFGGTTSTLTVCSNGFVSVATGNGTGYAPSAAGWLSSVAPRFGMWHDYNPAAAGSGSVKFQQIGAIAYVTWDGVFSYGRTTGGSRWQLQFDTATGNVTCAIQSVDSQGSTTNVGNQSLAGGASAGPSDDLGSMDITASLPAKFRISRDNLQPLSETGTLPQIGSVMTMTTTNYAASSVLGIHAMSLVMHNPGIDLTSVGMAGCFQFTGLESTIVVLPVGGQSTFAMNIPNSPSFAGLPLNAQTYALAIGANNLGLITSNGVAMVVGF
ncbi:MAG: hypothetical protein IT456_08340 [Planctomycetes bacterium]|nr:hypothetical protein [Planctomycetota bacterium]